MLHVSTGHTAPAPPPHLPPPDNVLRGEHLSRAKPVHRAPPLGVRGRKTTRPSAGHKPTTRGTEDGEDARDNRTQDTPQDPRPGVSYSETHLYVPSCSHTLSAAAAPPTQPARDGAVGARGTWRPRDEADGTESQERGDTRMLLGPRWADVCTRAG